MRLRIESCDLERLRPDETPARFTAVSARAPAVRENALECPDGDFAHPRVCAACAHFLRNVPSPDGRPVTVECVFLDSDPVEDIMTPARKLLVVDEDASLDSSAAVARLGEVRQLLVSCDDEVVGLVDSAKLLRAAEDRPLEPVATVMRRRIPLVPRTASLGTVATIFRRRGTRCLVVADGERVAGLITLGDLRRVGVNGALRHDP